MTEEKQLRELKLHQTITLDSREFDRIIVTRVLGGFIYTFFYTDGEDIKMNSIFIPLRKKKIKGI